MNPTKYYPILVDSMHEVAPPPPNPLPPPFLQGWGGGDFVQYMFWSLKLLAFGQLSD